jgi:choline dehydrogenase-like flavoprotein
MLIDLRQGAPWSRICAEVCIIGGGLAGLLAAHRLRAKGKRVVVLETGGREAHEGAHPLSEVEQRARPYDGAGNGRARCLGGTSTLWGGAMIPFLPSDLDERPFLGAPKWPVAFGELARFIPDIERLFALDTGSYDGEFLEAFGDAGIVPTRDPDFLARFAKWPRFRIRNLANLFRGELANDRGLQVWLHAHVTSIALDEARRRVASVSAQSPHGGSLEVTADQFVIAAGAIESTRLLLWLDRRAGGFLSRAGDALGRHFHDHVSILAADLEAVDPGALNRIAGLRFAGGTMRSLRFELSPAAQNEERVSSAFGHIHFTTSRPTSLDAIRELLRAAQKGAAPRWSDVGRAALGAPDIAAIAFWRASRRQLRWPRRADYYFHIVVEQLASPDNRIALADRLDSFGVPLASIDWRVLPQQMETLRAFARRFEAFWLRHGFARAARLRWRDFDTALADPAASKDVFHPGGSTRMGLSPQTGVVDRNLRVFGLDNLYVASTSAFPSGASANPTLMLMLFVCRLAESISARPDRL